MGYNYSQCDIVVWLKMVSTQLTKSGNLSFSTMELFGKEWLVFVAVFTRLSRSNTGLSFPYGSKHGLRRYSTLQIIPQTLPNVVAHALNHHVLYLYHTALAQEKKRLELLA